MATIRFDGLDAYARMLTRLEKGAPQIIEKAVRAGTSVVLDEIQKGIDTLPQKTGITVWGLSKGLGKAPILNENGFVNTRIGWDGYNERGVPNHLMANIMEVGTSKIQKKHPFVKPAVSRSKPQAEAKMAEVLDEEIEKIMK